MIKNNIYRVVQSVAKNLNTFTFLLAAVWTFASCAEDDIPGIPTEGKVGTLHIGAVNVDAGRVASRTTSTTGYNKVITALAEGSVITLNYDFVEGEDNSNIVYAKKTSTSSWALFSDASCTTSATIKPGADDNWSNFSANASLLATSAESTTDVGELNKGSLTVTMMYGDKLIASGSATAGKTEASTAGTIGFDASLTSATLGEVTIKFKHAHALLRLPVNAISVNILHAGVNVTSHEAMTFWAELVKESTKIYVPLTSVTVEESGSNVTYLQAIAPVDHNLKGFKAVMTDEHIIDLPFKVGCTSNTDYDLAENTMYKLNLTLSATAKEVSLTPSSKPGWGEEIEYKPYGLVYNTTSNAFEVYTAEGLQLLNRWMNSEDGANIVNIVPGVTSSNQSTLEANRKSRNINLMNDITFDDDTKIFNFDGTEGNESNWKVLQNYAGIFNGNNYTISGLSMHTTTGGIGLIDQLDGTVKDLVIDNASMNTEKSGTGILVAQVNTGGIVENCIVKNSTMNGGNTSEDIQVGAVVGNNYGYVVACQSIGNVVSGYDIVGGVVGYNKDGKVVACSNQSSSLTASNQTNPMVGGIVGKNDGTIYGSWTITGKTVQGGGGTTNTVSCFVNPSETNLGNQTGAELETMNGGIAVCNKNNGQEFSWYWVWENNTAVLSSGVPTLTTVTVGSEQKELGAVFSSDDGAANNNMPTVEVYTADALLQLITWINNGGDNKELIENGTNMNLTFNGDVESNGRTKINITLKDDIDLGEGTETNWYFNHRFQGVFDGAGHTIKNLRVSSTSGGSLSGMFDQVLTGGVVKNLTLENPNVKEEGHDSGIIVCANSGTIENCHVIGGNMQGKTGGIGGIVGLNSGTVKNCSVKDVKFTGETSASIGCIVGSGTGSVNNCTTSGCKINGISSDKQQGNK